MPLVVDSSVAISWMLADETSKVAHRALKLVAEEGMIAPRLLWYEFRNSLLVNERRSRLTVDETNQSLIVLEAVDPEWDDQHSESELMRLSRQYNLSAYDASYVEVALRRRASLATLDGKMAAAAVAEGIEVV